MSGEDSRSPSPDRGRSKKSSSPPPSKKKRRAIASDDDEEEEEDDEDLVTIFCFKLNLARKSGADPIKLFSG